MSFKIDFVKTPATSKDITTLAKFFVENDPKDFGTRHEENLLLELNL